MWPASHAWSASHGVLCLYQRKHIVVKDPHQWEGLKDWKIESVTTPSVVGKNEKALWLGDPCDLEIAERGRGCFVCVSGVWRTSPSGGLGAVCSIQLVSPASSHSPSPFHSLLKLWQLPPPPQAQVLPSIFVLSFEVVSGVATSTADQVSRI